MENIIRNTLEKDSTFDYYLIDVLTMEQINKLVEIKTNKECKQNETN